MIATIRRSSLKGEIRLPPSKSHTIRAVLLAALADGASVIHNPLAGGDGAAALRAARAFGAEVTEKEGSWIVKGLAGRPRVPEDVIDCGNSGTTVNFSMAVAALCQGYTVITGDSQIRRRPVQELVEALEALGARAFLTRPGQKAPPAVIGGPMRGGTARFSGFNSQVVSAALLAGALCPAPIIIEVENPREKPYIQMTIDWMRRYGAELLEADSGYRRFCLSGGCVYRGRESVIPGDWSAAAFPLAAAVCTPSELCISGLDFSDAQGDKIVVDHLIAMGADITRDTQGGRLLVRGGGASRPALPST